MEDPNELILPGALISVGFLVFLYPFGSDVSIIEDVAPYLCSAPFMLAGCFILSKRLRAVDGPKLSLANNLLSSEEYLEYKENQKARDQQSIGYMIMFGSAISAAGILSLASLASFFLQR